MTLEEAVERSPIHAALNGSGTHTSVLVMQFHGGGHVVRIQDASGRWLPAGTVHFATGLDTSAWQPLDTLPEDYGWPKW